MADPRLVELAGIDANVILMDSSIRHAVFMERFKTTAWRRAVGFLNDDVFPDLYGKLTTRLDRIASRGFDSGVFTTKRYRAMLEDMDKIIREGIAEMKALSLTKDYLPLAQREAIFTAGSMQSAVPGGLGLTFVPPSPPLLRSIVTSRPFEGRNLREWYRKLDVDTRNLVRSQINVGMAQGETTEQIVRRLRGTKAQNFTDGAMQTTRREATTITRTAVNHIQAHAREATYKENDDIVKGVRFVATLDNRTTFQCASLDGQVFPVNEGERPPIHMQCRSTTTPVLKSWKELGIDLKEAPPGTRESLSGKVPATETYPEWFRRQPRATQREILGPGRLELFDEGRITSVRDLLGPTGQPLTLDQLFKKAS